MSGFQIPGLGQAKPNEILPPLPADILVAAASVGDVQVPSTDAADGKTAEEEPATDTTDGLSRDNPSNDTMNVDAPESPPSLTGALEAAIGGLGTESNAPGQSQPPAEEVELENDQGEHPEWEVDSSPYESSDSSDSSSSDSSDEDSDQEGYELLGVEEMGRLLMEAEGGSDDEGDRGKGTSAAQLRTKNEIAEVILPKPDITVTEEMKIEELGSIENIVDTIVLIKAITPGEYQVLDTGSVLCTTERKVIGVVAETIGKVLQPMYTVYFSSADEIKELGLEVGTKLFYPVDHASYVFTEPLKNLKGSDASNIHDEEVGDDEMEFSDDEKEAEYKKAKKQKHKDKSKGKNGASTGGSTRSGPHPLSQEMTVNNDCLNYDDDDGPYKPLARPPGFGTSSGPVSNETPETNTRGGPRRGGGRGGDARGRGGGRGRGSGRGAGASYGRGGGQHRGPSRDGYALPPQGHSQSYPAQSLPLPPPPPPPHAAQTAPPPALPNFGFQFPGWPPNPAGPVQAATPFAAAAAPPPPPGWPAQPGASPAAAAAAASNAFLNPAFMAVLMSQMQQQSGQQAWGGQPPQPPPGPGQGQ
ncbi:hypothetical protein E4U43_006094 [Claviceps pusilla]|uniref:H/ACA ribonucleoprotein complex non-core subunit NAF1 n=1 Tax=Claviceps pusilla TaxID=123648 RepID=A0A9P7N268_9HYPO|nr:hypothetical protein E4U43_006094 [Claviceps pusilla]